MVWKKSRFAAGECECSRTIHGARKERNRDCTERRFRLEAQCAGIHINQGSFCGLVCLYPIIIPHRIVSSSRTVVHHAHLDNIANTHKVKSYYSSRQHRNLHPLPTFPSTTSLVPYPLDGCIVHNESPYSLYLTSSQTSFPKARWNGGIAR